MAAEALPRIEMSKAVVSTCCTVLDRSQTRDKQVSDPSVASAVKGCRKSMRDVTCHCFAHFDCCPWQDACPWIADGSK